MRNQVVIGVNVTYPEEVCFINDRNVVSLKYLGANNKSVGAALFLANTLGDTVTLTYNSEKDNLTINLMSALKKLMNNDVYSEITVSGYIICGETSGQMPPFNLKCADGRTLHSRPHNSERILYYYDQSDLTGVQFLMEHSGMIGSSYVQSGVRKVNLSAYHGDFGIMIIDGGVRRVVNVKHVVLGGDNGYDSGCEEGDSSTGVFRVVYFNTDGCMRTLQGKVINRKRTVALTDWRADELVRHTPNGMITTTTDEITVGFPNVERLSYAEDIMFSNRIEYLGLDGEYHPCTISSKSLQLNDWETNDLQITFKTLA